jgi:hypothetical protein
MKGGRTNNLPRTSDAALRAALLHLALLLKGVEALIAQQFGDKPKSESRAVATQSQLRDLPSANEFIRNSFAELRHIRSYIETSNVFDYNATMDETDAINYVADVFGIPAEHREELHKVVKRFATELFVPAFLFQTRTKQTLAENALLDAAAETTDCATAAPRPDWIEARKEGDGRRRGSKPIADVLEGFIRTKFADELADGTMSTQKLYRYGKELHAAYYNHRDELPADLRDMPTRSEVNDRMVAEGKVKPVRPRVPRTDEQRAFEKGTRQQQRARQRGVVPT